MPPCRSGRRHSRMERPVRELRTVPCRCRRQCTSRVRQHSRRACVSPTARCEPLRSSGRRADVASAVRVRSPLQSQPTTAHFCAFAHSAAALPLGRRRRRTVEPAQDWCVRNATQSWASAAAMPNERHRLEHPLILWPLHCAAPPPASHKHATDATDPPVALNRVAHTA